MAHYSYGVDMGVVRNMEGNHIAFAISTRLNGVEQYLIPISEVDLIRRRIHDEYSVIEILRFNKQNLHFAFITHEAALDFHVQMIQMCEKILRGSGVNNETATKST